MNLFFVFPSTLRYLFCPYFSGPWLTAASASRTIAHKNRRLYSPVGVGTGSISSPKNIVDVDAVHGFGTCQPPAAPTSMRVPYLSIVQRSVSSHVLRYILPVTCVQSSAVRFTGYPAIDLL